MFSSLISVSLTVKTDKRRIDYENWLRVVILIDHAGKSLCYEILHTKEHLPCDGGKLYCELEKYQDNMHYQIHKEVLCPLDKFIDEKKFDLLIYSIVIYSIFGAKYKELLDDVGDMRDEIFHMQEESICTVEPEELWRKACVPLCKHGFNTESLNYLKTFNLFSVEKYKGILQFLPFL